MYRFAPSPTGDMNISNLRVALFNYISARQNNEKFLIRIEDTDKEHNIERKNQEILEILSLFGINYDQVIHQSENLKFHQQLATKLLMDKNAFSCFCTPQILEQKKEKAKHHKTTYKYDQTCKNLSDEEVLNNESPFVIRIKKPNEPITFTDEIQGKLTFTPDAIDDFVIMHVDKTPTYDFACAIDDMMYDISTVIRDENHLSNTPKQILIHNYLGYDKKIVYAHLPILDTQGDDISVKWLLEEGFLPASIINYLILGSTKTPTEIFSLEDAIEWFNLSSISKTPIKFDMAKLRQLNREHIKLLDPKELAKAIGYSSEELGNLAKIYTQEDSTLQEIKLKIDKFFASKTCDEFPHEFEKLKKIAKDAPYHKTFDTYKAYLLKQSELKEEQFSKPFRALLTGETSGPNLADIYPYIKNYLGEIIK